MVGKLGHDKFVSLKEDTHQYFDQNNDEYKSVSYLLSKVKMPFPRKERSYQMAKSQLPSNATAEEIGVEQNRILESWDILAKSSTDWGTYVHGNLEAYFTIGSCDDKDVLRAAQSIGQYFSNVESFLPELIVYDSQFKLAGTMDLGVLRKRGSKPHTTILDIFDFKTNERRGIEFDTSYIKNGIYNAGGKYMLPPVEHLEECNYNVYSLQLSLYALMVQNTYKVKIGRLGILFIDKSMNVDLFPVPYLKYEAMQLFELLTEIKQLP